MKRIVIILVIFLSLSVFRAPAQCSICSKTTQQMGDKPAKGFNAGIIYLMLTPFAIFGVIGYRWWKGQPEQD